MCGAETLFNNSLRLIRGLLLHKKGDIMIERGLYYATPQFTEMIRSVGGVWNDSKHRPIVCLINAREHAGLYWAIPMGQT